LDELKSLDQLDVLELPDDFKYKDEPFFSYYKEHLVKALNRFRINKEFRSESNKRLDMARTTALKVIEEKKVQNEIGILESDGSYLFNLMILNKEALVYLEEFTLRLARERGLSVLPYQAGFVRFSLGGYLDGSAAGNEFFRKEIEQAVGIFIDYWSKLLQFSQEKETNPDQLLEKVFPQKSAENSINDRLQQTIGYF